MKYKIKLIVGFRRDQEHSIPAAEAHKAYFLFLNPTQRGVFSNGLAIKGDQIQEIVPDWQGTMGWNATHVIDTDDWNEIHTKGVSRKMQMILQAAKEVGRIGNLEELAQPLPQLLKTKYAAIGQGTRSPTAALADKFKI
jgi:hypothetical protein